MSDRELLNRYLSGDSHEAFAEITLRNTNLVYAACLRVLGDPHAAEDATQATFLVLMRKAAASTTVLGLVKTTIKIMLWVKIKAVAAIVTASVLLATSAAALSVSASTTAAGPSSLSEPPESNRAGRSEAPSPVPPAIPAAQERAKAKKAAAQADKAEILAKLQRRVSFEFVETPVSESLQFFGTLTKVKFVLDPRIGKAANRTVNFKAQNMTLNNVLRWIARHAGLDFTFQRGAILFSTADRLNGELGDEPFPPRAVQKSTEVALAWKREIRRKLQRKIDFEFIDTPLSEVFQFFQTLTNANIVIDPKLLPAPQAQKAFVPVEDVEVARLPDGTILKHEVPIDGDKGPNRVIRRLVTFKAQNCSFEQAIKRLLILVHADSVLLDEALYIYQAKVAGDGLLPGGRNGKKAGPSGTKGEDVF